MKTKNLFKIFLMSIAGAIGATQAQASNWSITFDGKVTTDKTGVNISETVATIGGVTMGTTSWGTLTETSVFTGPTDQNYAANDISLATLTGAGAEAGKQLIVYATITNPYSYGLTLQANWDSNTSLEFSDWQGADNGREINQNHPNAYDGMCFKMTIGENTLGKLNESTPLKVISNGMIISKITIASGDGGLLDPKFVLQTGTSWLLRTGTQGLYSANSGARAFGLLDCKAGEVITINASFDPAPTTNVTLKSENENIFKYVVTADGDVAFKPARYINIHSIAIDPGYSVTFKVGDEVVKTAWYEAGETVAEEPAPTQEGYTFSGWSGYPENMVMQTQNVTVSGSFSVNHHDIMYKVDGNYYQGYYYVAYGTPLSPDYVPANPTKEGATFVGWENLPETMPDYDLVLNAIFTETATYTISYTVDGVVVATETLAEGQVPTPPATATKTGYTFTGWSDVPATMPAEDVTVTALFTVNSYTLTYMVDGEVYGTPETVAYGTVITPKAEPTKEGYTFTGWQNVPATMPAQDVVISGMFNKDKAYTTFAVGISGYATFCSTKALRFVGNEAVKAYIAKSKNSNVVVLQQVIGSVAAGTGLVLKGSANATATIEEVETGSTYNNNLLVGVTSGSVTINAANKYVLVVKNGVVKFADTDGREAVVPAGKSYLQVNASARELTFEFEDDTTGIDAADNENQVDGSIYNLRGVRVEKPGKGLYIINGKKVFIK